MGVTVACRAPAARAWTRHVRVRGTQILRLLGLGHDELSLALVDDAEIRALNAAYRKRDRPTDVLAFALTEDASPGVPLSVAMTARRARVLGDVVISIDTAAAQARDDGVDVAARLDALLIHGVLHLVGYDHERSHVEERRMQRKERALRAALPRLASGHEVTEVPAPTIPSAAPRRTRESRTAARPPATKARRRGATSGARR